ncbi:MAG: hypothetical protein ABH867_01925 [Patescibacteria group bacterium]
METGPLIDYKTLRKINPEADRRAVVEYLQTNRGNIAKTARVFGIQRPVIYGILKKQKEGDLKDRSKRLKTFPQKTPDRIEDQVIRVKNKTRLGPKRLSRYLQKYQKLVVAPGTIRHILRRNKNRLTYKVGRRKKREKREFVDWYRPNLLRLSRSTLNTFVTRKP